MVLYGVTYTVLWPSVESSGGYDGTGEADGRMDGWMTGEREKKDFVCPDGGVDGDGDGSS